ncbi:hypothetical protein NG831_03785 [Xanthomonas sacchari]|nr:hypothetical protein [Xanthomonas sacchari]UYK67326.1 hypothetical protein NG831_03785 [Xanthomonas sacchari]
MPQPLASRLTCDNNVDGRCVTRPATGANAIGTSSSTGMSRGDSVRNCASERTMRSRPSAWPVFNGRKRCSRSSASCVTKASPADLATCSCSVELVLNRSVSKNDARKAASVCCNKGAVRTSPSQNS